MRQLFALFFLFGAFASAAPADSLSYDLDAIGDRQTRWDIDLDAGGVLAGTGSSLQLKARGGRLWVAGPWLRSLGVAGKIQSPFGWNLGVEGEILKLDAGVWGQLNLGYAQTDGLVAAVSAGFSFFGVEFTSQLKSSPDWAVLGKIRIPIGVIWYALDGS